MSLRLASFDSYFHKLIGKDDDNKKEEIVHANKKVFGISSEKK